MERQVPKESGGREKEGKTLYKEIIIIRKGGGRGNNIRGIL